jgi:DNA-binding transcriptional ArsR family regulator
MLRVYFTGEDLARVRVAGAPDPLWETLLSVHQLTQPGAGIVFGQWRSRALTRLAPAMRMLLDLAPPNGYSPDFLTPSAASGGLEAGIDAVLHTPKRQLGAELGLLSKRQRPREWSRPLAGGDPATLRRLGEALRLYYERILAPHWSPIHAAIDADRAIRARAFLDGGVNQVLARLHPTIRWQPPVLEVGYGPDRELHLDGRGLLLLPSFFCWRDPISLQDNNLPPVLVYPVEREPGWAAPIAGSPDGPRALAAVLGRTRAAVLRTIEANCTTGGLAQRLGISLASASEHATQLREAGLITTHRDGKAVFHTLSPLGQSLIRRGQQR